MDHRIVTGSPRHHVDIFRLRVLHARIPPHIGDCSDGVLPYGSEHWYRASYQNRNSVFFDVLCNRRYGSTVPRVRYASVSHPTDAVAPDFQQEGGVDQRDILDFPRNLLHGLHAKFLGSLESTWRNLPHALPFNPEAMGLDSRQYLDSGSGGDLVDMDLYGFR